MNWSDKMREALLRAEDKAKITDRFPFLIAAPFSFAIQDHMGMTYEWARHTGSLLIRYLGAIMISNFSRDIKCGRFDHANMNAVRKPIEAILGCLGRKKTDGSWKGVFQEVLRIYDSRLDHLFVPELAEMAFSQGRYLKEWSLLNDIDEFINIRNLVVHEAPASEDKIAICESLAKCLLSASFIAEYPLVEITRKEGDFYYYKKWMSSTLPKLEDVPIKSKEHLPIDFHLENGNKFLNMYYLLLGIDDLFSDKRFDLGILKSIKSAVSYVFATKRAEDEVTSTVYALRYLIEILREGKRKTERTQSGTGIQPDWADIRTSAVKASSQYMRAISGLEYDLSGNVTHKDSDEFTKYDPEAYQDRGKATDTFDRFVDSQKQILALVGSSGVGKSSFLIRMWERMKERDDVAALLVSAVDLNPKQDFHVEILNRFLRFGNEKIANMAFPMKGQSSISGTIIVMLDAINENAQDPAKILTSICRDLRAYNCEHLKVVLTSRPHAWDIIRATADPPRALFYRLSDKESSRSLMVRMEGFVDDNELMAAYAKYKARYEVQTEFSQLAPAVRELIRDPLVLHLLCRAHRGQQLPNTLGKAEVYRTYKKKIIELGRDGEQGGLQGVDFEFLNQAVKLMAENEINSLSSELIERPEVKFDVHLVADRQPVAIPLERLINDPAVNESYMRLTRAGILTELKGGGKTESSQEDDAVWLQQELSYSVGFRFESFFDHEVGEYLWKSWGGETGEGPERQEKMLHGFRSLIDRINSGDAKPFMWGPLRVALALEMREGHSDTLLKLACLGQKHIKDTLVNAIEYYGKGYTNVEKGVEKLLLQIADLSRRTLPILTESITSNRKERLRLALQLAGDVADRLSLPEPLVKLASRSEQEIRLDAIRHAFSVWERGWRKRTESREGQVVPPAGGKFFNLLTEECTERGILTCLVSRDFDALKSLFEFTGMLMMVHTRHEAIRSILWNNWSKNILQKSIFSTPGEGIHKRLPKWLVRKIIPFALRGMVARRLKRASPNVVTNYREFLSFFPNEKEDDLRLSPEDRKSVKDLVKYLDPEADFDSPDTQEILFRANSSGDALLSCIAYAAFCVHGAREPESLVPYCERIFIENPLGPGLANAGRRGGVIQFFYLACDKYSGTDPDKISETHLDLLKRMAITALHEDRGLYGTRVGQYYNSKISDPALWDWTYIYRCFPLHWYAALYTKKYGDKPIPTYTKLVEEQLEMGDRCDIHKLRSLVDSIGAFRADLRCFRGMFEAVRPIMDKDFVDRFPKIRGPVTSKCECRNAEEARKEGKELVCTIRECLLRNLGRVRNYDEQVVDDYLRTCRVDQAIEQAVLRNEDSESLGGVFAKMDWFIMDALETEGLRKYVVDMYGMLPSCRSLKEWIGKILIYFIENLQKACSKR